MLLDGGAGVMLRLPSWSHADAGLTRTRSMTMLSKRPDDALARIQSDRRLKINRNIVEPLFAVQQVI